MAKITMIGFYNYMLAHNDNLFALLDVPAYINKETLIDTILMRCNEFEVLYSEPYYLKHAIGTFSQKWYRTFEKWVNALQVEYNPLENYDRIEEWSEKNTGTVQNTGSGSNTGTVTEAGNTSNTGTVTDAGSTTNTGTVKNESTGSDTSSGTTSNTEQNDVSAYNSSGYQADNKKTQSGTNGNTTDTELESLRTDNLTATTSNTRTDNLAATSNNTRTDDLHSTHTDTRTDNLTLAHNGRLHGNIGVTTSQQMLQAELDIATWNLYEHIADIFMQEFTIMVY